MEEILLDYIGPYHGRKIALALESTPGETPIADSEPASIGSPHLWIYHGEDRECYPLSDGYGDRLPFLVESLRSAADRHVDIEEFRQEVVGKMVEFDL